MSFFCEVYWIRPIVNPLFIESYHPCIIDSDHWSVIFIVGIQLYSVLSTLSQSTWAVPPLAQSWASRRLTGVTSNLLAVSFDLLQPRTWVYLPFVNHETTPVIWLAWFEAPTKYWDVLNELTEGSVYFSTHLVDLNTISCSKRTEFVFH